VTTRHEQPVYGDGPTGLLSVSDLARFLGISRPTVYRMVRRRELVPYRVGERLRFRCEDVHAYLERNRV
jgi:excisionase family DNA binding protein